MTTPDEAAGVAQTQAQAATNAMRYAGDQMTAAREAAHAVANAWRAEGDTATDRDHAARCFSNAASWDGIADEWNRHAKHIASTAVGDDTLLKRIDGRIQMFDRDTIEKRLPSDEPPDDDRFIEWRGQFAFIGEKHVGVLSMAWMGWRIGVWNSDDGKMHWCGFPDYDYDADAFLTALHDRGELDSIPPDADLFP